MPSRPSWYYPKCFIGGAVSCGVTHSAVLPLDVIKCRMQVNPGMYTGLLPTLKLILKSEGAGALIRGWQPTLYGYSSQGFFKFGLYEVFKDRYAYLVGKERAEAHKGKIWLLSSATAEVTADVALCPFEMTKIKMQTVEDFPRNYKLAKAKMMTLKAETRYPFGSLVPLWSRQVPYTMAKFFCFERTVNLFYSKILSCPKENYSRKSQLAVTFASGYIAGVVCAVVSQPADNLISQIGKSTNKGKTLSAIARDVGLSQLCTKGLGTRVVMIGMLTGFQWWIYDGMKSAMNLQTSG